MRKLVIIALNCVVAVIAVFGFQSYMSNDSSSIVMGFRNSGLPENVELDFENSGDPEFVEIGFENSGDPEFVEIGFRNSGLPENVEL